MTMLARTTARMTRKANCVSKARGEGAKTAVASLAVSDVTGQVWTHPNPLHLYHWVDSRNALLRNLEAMGRLGVRV